MSIQVFYDEFSTKEPNDSYLIKARFRKDISWSTFMDDLYASKEACGVGAEDRWRQYEPALYNIPYGKSSDKRFMLEFRDDHFNFESEGVDHFIGTIAGDILLYEQLNNIIVDDFIITTPEILSVFPGPNIGIDGIYNELLAPTLKGVNRPILAFSLKPRMGLNVSDYVTIYKEAAQSNIDIIEDDERLIDPVYCPFKERVDRISEIQNKYSTKYSVNITGPLDKALERLDYAVSKGIKIVKIDVMVTGFDVLRKVAMSIKENKSKVAITVYPDALHNYRRLNRRFVLKMARLCGADIIYAGSPTWSRFNYESNHIKEALEYIYSSHRELSSDILNGPHIKQTLPTITNDYHVSRAELITVLFKKYFNHSKYAFFVGGGISCFPHDIHVAVNEWISCLKHASQTLIENYKPYNFDKYEKDFRRIRWDIYDVEEALKK